MRRLHTLQRAIPTGAGDPLRHPSIGGSVSAGGGGTPTLSSATVASTGKTISLVFSESVSVGAGGNGGWTITPSANTATMTYASGSGTNTLVYNLDTYVCNTETFTVSYTQPGNGIEATTGGGDVANITNLAGTNSSTVPLPDVWYKCEDNAANNTLTATYGSNGSIWLLGDPSNSSSNTSTTAFKGSRSYKPAGGTGFAGTPITRASIEDGVFTIQFAYRADNTSGFPSSAYVRIFTNPDSEGTLYFYSNAGSSTSLRVGIGGTDYTGTFDDINTNTWHVIRIVVDTEAASDKIRMYQASTETALALKYESDAAAVTAPSGLTSNGLMWGGEGANANKGIYVRNGLLDDIKIWYTAVVP